MKFNVLERLVMLNLLPKEGSFANLKLLRVAREALSFDEKENKALKFKQVGEQLNWEDNVVADKEIQVGEVVSQMLKKELKKLNESEKLLEEHFSLYEKFVEPPLHPVE